MEHLLAPAGSQPLDIPYVGGPEFEASPSQSDDVLYNFKSYWERIGWHRYQDTGELSFENHSPEETTQVLQASLYFGVLISIFARVGIPVRTRDFLDASPSQSEKSEGAEEKIFVRTTKLHGLIAEWIKREGLADGPVVGDFNDPKYMRGANIAEILNWTFYYLENMFCRQSRGAVFEPHHRERAQLVELSIMAMAESLFSVTAAVYGYDMRAMPTWGPSPVLQARLRASGWCPSDSPFFPESMSRAAISTDYYFGGLACPRPRGGGDHSRCTMAICNEYCKKIDPETYEQKHAPHGCDCAEEQEPLEMPDEAFRLVAQRQVPVVQWDGKSIRVSAASSRSRCVVISHVWSDGLGNDDKRNYLWPCQLSRIQALVNELYAGQPPEPNRRGETTTSSAFGSSIRSLVSKLCFGWIAPLSSSTQRQTNYEEEEEGMVPFWIDTLCVPVGEKAQYSSSTPTVTGLNKPKTRNLRKEAIRQMADIYRDSDSVLVLDAFVESLPRGADTVAKYLRIHLSTWHHRLWTMQEGQLARRLVFRFRDGAESFADIRAAELQALDRRSPQTLCSPVRLLCATELERFYRDSELGGARKNNDRNNNDNNNNSARFHDGGRSNGGDMAARLRSCARYLRGRDTTRREDESVCVANILGLDGGRVLDARPGGTDSRKPKLKPKSKPDAKPISDADAVADARMARLYDLVGHFDPRIIFHDHPRLPRDGYRWAPRSFLRQLPDLVNFPPEEQSSGAAAAARTAIIPAGGGLPVRFAGFEFSSDELPPVGKPIFVRQITDGRGWAPRWEGDTRMPWFACTYKIEIQDVLDGDDVPPPPAARPGRRWAVVMPGFLERDGLFEDRGLVLGIVDENTPPSPVATGRVHQTAWTVFGSANVHLPAYSVPYRIPIRYVCRVRLTMPPQETIPQDVPFIGTWAYSDKQEWCIR